MFLYFWHKMKLLANLLYAIMVETAMSPYVRDFSLK